jgi:hypothetical protein
MSRTTRVRVLNLDLHRTLTHGQGVLQGTGRILGAQRAMDAGAVMNAGAAVSAMSARAAVSSMGAADLLAIQQRTLIAETTRAALAEQGWTVTVVDGGDADRYTGIEATRGTEHLVAAVGADDLIADQAGAHDCAATVDAITAGLEAIGATATVVDDVPHDGQGGSLYALDGGPTKAHAIAATLRRKATASQRHGEGPAPLRAIIGDH